MALVRSSSSASSCARRLSQNFMFGLRSSSVGLNLVRRDSILSRAVRVSGATIPDIYTNRSRVASHELLSSTSASRVEKFPSRAAEYATLNAFIRNILRFNMSFFNNIRNFIRHFSSLGNTQKSLGLLSLIEKVRIFLCKDTHDLIKKTIFAKIY